MRRYGLRQRFIFVIFPLFVVLFSVVAALLVYRTAVTERITLNEQTKSYATLATKPISDAFLLYKDSGTLRIKQQVDNFTALNPDVTAISIVDTSGKTLFSSGSTGQISMSEAETFDPLYQKTNGVINRAIVPVIEDNHIHRYAIVYKISDKRLNENTKRNVELIVLLSTFAFGVAILVTYWLINHFFLSPVREISAKALVISKGEFDEQIEVKRNDELGDLSNAVNTMANSLKADIVKLKEADKLKSEFITISSHNLRTPLMVIKGELEMIEDIGGALESIKEPLANMSASTAQLANFIEDLLAISSIESGRLARAEMQPTPIVDLLNRIKDDYTHRGEEKHVAFNPDISLTDADKVVMSDHMMKIVLVNLLENAFKFTKEGSVTFKATADDKFVTLQVIDTGIGIAAEEIPKLFTKFHRGTSLMRYDYEGTGIGLYLTKLIIDNHQGTIDVESHEGKGTTFTIKLPKTT